MTKFQEFFWIEWPICCLLNMLLNFFLYWTAIFFHKYNISRICYSMPIFHFRFIGFTIRSSSQLKCNLAKSVRQYLLLEWWKWNSDFFFFLERWSIDVRMTFLGLDIQQLWVNKTSKNKTDKKFQIEYHLIANKIVINTTIFPILRRGHSKCVYLNWIKSEWIFLEVHSQNTLLIKFWWNSENSWYISWKFMDNKGRSLFHLETTFIKCSINACLSKF